MSTKGEEQKDKQKSLRTYYKFVILNEKTLRSTTLFRLTKRGTMLAVGVVFVCIFAIISALVVFTPVRYYLPNSTHTRLRSKLIDANLKIDSLNNYIKIQDAQLQVIKSAINGEVPIDTNFSNLDSLVVTQIDSINLAKTDREAEFCKKHELQQLRVLEELETSKNTTKTQQK